MGISSNQARFLSLTARQVDLEHRVQQICQRRLRLSSELERVATSYNNDIGNRKMFTFNTTNSGISQLLIGNAATGTGIEGLKDSNGVNYKVLATSATAGEFVGITDANITILKTNGTVTPAGGVAITLTQLGLTTSASNSEIIEAAIRNGVLTVASVADEFTQTPSTVTGSTTEYELRDWRTLPELADELFRGDDMDAENKYDRIVSQINAQDKKLQLEQASVEVEYKAISSEKEAVKKILDTNASASFKYFS